MKVVTKIMCLLFLAGASITTASGQTRAKLLGAAPSPVPSVEINKSTVAGGQIGNEVGAINTKVAPETNVGANVKKVELSPSATPIGISEPKGVAMGEMLVAPTNGGNVAWSPTQIEANRITSGSQNVAFGPQFYTPLPEAKSVDGGHEVCLSPTAKEETRPRFIVKTGRLGWAYTEPATQEGKGIEDGLVTRQIRPTLDGWEMEYVEKHVFYQKTPERYPVHWGWVYLARVFTHGAVVNGSFMGALSKSDQNFSAGSAGQSSVTDTEEKYTFLGRRCVANADMIRVWEGKIHQRNCIFAEKSANPKMRKWVSENCVEKAQPAQQQAQAPARQPQQKQ